MASSPAHDDETRLAFSSLVHGGQTVAMSARQLGVCDKTGRSWGKSKWHRTHLAQFEQKELEPLQVDHWMLAKQRRRESIVASAQDGLDGIKAILGDKRQRSLLTPKGYADLSKAMLQLQEASRRETGEDLAERKAVAAAGKAEPQQSMTLALFFKEVPRAERVAMAESLGMCPVPDRPCIEPD